MQNDNTPLLKAFFQNKWIRLILVLDIAIIAIVAYISIRQIAKVSNIHFNVTPIDATISVNGDTHYKNGLYSIAPGRYEVKISRDGLETKTISVELGARDYASVAAFLTGENNSFDFYEQNKNYDSFRKLKEIAAMGNNITTDKDNSAQDFVSKYSQKLSFFEKLPIKGYVYADPNINSSTAGFAIRSGLNDQKCEKSSCLIVNYYGKGYEGEVAKKIKAAGYNPEDYQIIYERYSK